MHRHKSKIRVEKVYANSYYQNLLLHLPKSSDFEREIKNLKVLQTNKQITSVYLRRLKPQTESYILQWEDYNGVFLPNDLKDFYLANDGFLFVWTFNPIPEKSPVLCGININCLNDLDAITGYELSTKAGISIKNGRKVLALSINSRIFELEPLGEGNQACVCLVYYNVWLRPTVWLWSKSNGFFYLSKDFTTYFRMCIAHLGIIGWQYTFTSMVLPKWTRRIMRKIAPHLLRSPYDYTVLPQEQTPSTDSDKNNLQNQIVKDVIADRCILWSNRYPEEKDELIINKLDANVFANTTVVYASLANNNNNTLDQINKEKSRPLSVGNNIRSKSKGNLKKGKSSGKKTNSSKSATGYYSRRNIASPKVDFRRSKHSCKK